MRPTTLDMELQAEFVRPTRRAGNVWQRNDVLFIRSLEYCINFVTASLIFAAVYHFLTTMLGDSALSSARQHLLLGNLVFSAVVVAMLKHAGAYRESSGLLRIRETACVLRGCVFSLSVIIPSVMLLNDRFSYSFLAIAFPVIALLLVVEKYMLHGVFEALRRNGVGVKRALIYGAGATGKRLFATLTRSPRLGLLPVAMLDPAAGSETIDSFSASLLRSYNADVVLVASGGLSRSQVLHVVAQSKQANVQVAFAADLDPDYAEPVAFTELDGEVLYGPTNSGSTLSPCFSRFLDIAVSLILLTAASPLLLLIGLAVRAESAGPVFFRQQRVGKDGALFTILKFRSMHSALCGNDRSPESSADSRITRAGRFLRKTSLDELPQLINILRGEMALVGPRPEMPFIVDQYNAIQRCRLAVRPGLTGIWQISADRCRPIHENIHYDLYYLRNRSVYIDVAILFHTALFAMKGI